MLQTPSIRVQIEGFTAKGNRFLSEGAQSGSQAAYLRAIQEFSSSYKYALLLNSKDGTVQLCAFNLGAAHIAGGDASRGIALLLTVLEHGGWPKDEDKAEGKTYRGDVHFNLAAGYEKLSDMDSAMKNYSNALLQYDREEDPRKVGETYVKIANIYNARKEYSEARRNFELAAKLYLKLGDTTNAVVAQTCQANAAVLDKTFIRGECLKLLNSCCKNCAELKTKGLQGKILCEVGLLYSMLGSLERALLCFDKSVMLCEEAHIRRKALALQNAGAILNTLGYYEEAIPRHSESAQLHGALGNRNAQGQSFCNLAFANSKIGHFEESWEAYLHALKAFEDTDDQQGQWQCHEGLGAIAYNSGRLEKAVKHFNLALSCQTGAIDDGSRNRVLYKLTNALKTSGQPMEGVKRLAIKNGTKNDTKTPPVYDDPTKDSSSSSSTSSNEEDVVDSKPSPTAKPRRNMRRKRTAELERGRREYADENDRPVRQIARGISNLTEYSNPYADGQTFVSRDSESDDSDIPDFLKDANSLSRPSSSIGSSVYTNNKTVKGLHNPRSRRKHLRGLVKVSTMPINALTAARDDSTQTPEPPPFDEQETIANQTTESEKITPRSDMSSSGENAVNVYKAQLTKIDENKSDEDDFTDVTEESSSSSSSESSPSNKRHNTAPKKVLASRRKRTSATYVNDELPETPSLTATASDGKTLDSTHLYASIKTEKRDTLATGEDTMKASGTYARVLEPAGEQSSGEDIPPLLTAHSPRNAGNDTENDGGPASTSNEHENQTASIQQPWTPAPAPPLPRIPPPSNEKMKKKKNDQSRACSVM